MNDTRKLLERLVNGHDGPHEHDLNLSSSPCRLCDALVKQVLAFLAQPTCEAREAALAVRLREEVGKCVNCGGLGYEPIGDVGGPCCLFCTPFRKLLADISPAAAALLARVESQDTDLTEIATTMTEHFDSVDLNDLPVSLTKGILALLAQVERIERASRPLFALARDSGGTCRACGAASSVRHDPQCVWTIFRAALGEEKA